MYPFYKRDATYTILKDSGIVRFIDNGEIIRLNKNLAEFLVQLDGNKTLQENLVQYYSGAGDTLNSEIYLTSAQMLHLVSRGVIALRESPGDQHISVLRYEKAFYPRTMHLELTANCNLNCFYCYRKAGETNDGKMMPASKWLNIISDLIDRGLTLGEITGGEPLLHPDFMEIFEYCARHLEVVSVISNGTLFTPKIINKLLEYKNKVVISISLDSYLPEEHDRRRGKKGCFEKVVETIRILASHGFLFRVSMAVDEQNWSHLEKTLVLAKELGASRFGYSPVIPFGRAEDKQAFWSIAPDDVRKHDRYLREKYPDFIHVVPEERKLDIFLPGSCGAGSSGYVTDPEGNVRMCAMCDSGTGVLGNLLTQTPEEVFNNTFTWLSSKITPPSYETCLPCPYTYFCLGCVLRGHKGAEIVGKDNCKWMKEPYVEQWCEIIEQ